MKIGIIDADLIGRKNHRFPNLACMKISGFYKSQNNEVELITNYDQLKNLNYDKIFLSKVFTDTKVPEYILNYSNLEYGGTGFYYDLAPDLPYEIEHHMPDYNLYSDWVNIQIKSGKPRNNFEDYLDFSMGFTTRGCFRKCSFCVNKKYNTVLLHSPIEEFLDVNRKYICLLDDNFLGYPKYNEVLNKLIESDKYFQFKQGLDLRLLTDKKCEVLSKVKYKGNYIFAFDDIDDRESIEKKLTLWRKYYRKNTKLYVLCGFDKNDIYNDDFWIKDIQNTFERIKILMKYGALPYIMRYEKYNESPYKGLYIAVAGWCNSPQYFISTSFNEYLLKMNEYAGKETNSYKIIELFMNNNDDISKKYFDLKFEDLNEYSYRDIEDASKWNGIKFDNKINAWYTEDIKNIKNKSLDLIICEQIGDYNDKIRDYGLLCLKNNVIDSDVFEWLGKVSDYNIYSLRHDGTLEYNNLFDNHLNLRKYIGEVMKKSNLLYCSPQIIELFTKNGYGKNYLTTRQMCQSKLSSTYTKFILLTEDQYNLLTPLLNFDRLYEDLRIEYDKNNREYIRLKKELRRNKKIFHNKINDLKNIQLPNNIEDFILKNSDKDSIILTDKDIVINNFLGQILYLNQKR